MTESGRPAGGSAGSGSGGGARAGGSTRTGGSTGRGATGGRPVKWGLTSGEAEALLAGARNALFVMVTFLALIWLIQVLNWAEGYQLTQDYGIRPRSIGSLPDLLTAPFLHVSWAHIEGNSGPLFIFGFLAAYRGIGKFLSLTGVVILTSGLGAWLTEAPHTVGVGASGVVFGYFGYIMVRGFFDRRAVDMVIGAVMALCFAYQFTVLLPHAGIGWQAHIGGLIGGVLAGWVFRERRAGAAVPAAPAAPAAAGSGTTSAVDRAELLRKIDELGI